MDSPASRPAVLGYFFFETGWNKSGNLDAMAERFAGWGIPWPAFNAALSGYIELAGGALIVLGLATRLAAIPLCFNMIVAILVVNLRNVTEFDEFFELSEPLSGADRPAAIEASAPGGPRLGFRSGGECRTMPAGGAACGRGGSPDNEGRIARGDQPDGHADG